MKKNEIEKMVNEKDFIVLSGGVDGGNEVLKEDGYKSLEDGIYGVITGNKTNSYFIEPYETDIITIFKADEVVRLEGRKDCLGGGSHGTTLAIKNNKKFDFFVIGFQND